MIEAAKDAPKELAAALVNRGAAYWYMNKMPQAFADLDRAIALDPKNARAFRERSNRHRSAGRLDRALALINDPGDGLDRATEIELRIVESGVRRDQGLPDAAVVALQVPELTDGRTRPWSARLFYAYADALLEAGRDHDARAWFGRAAAADAADETDAAERCEDLDQIMIDDLMEPADAAEHDAAEHDAAEDDAAEDDASGDGSGEERPDR